MSGLVHSMDKGRTKQRLRRRANFNRHIEPPTHHFRVSGQTSQSICRFNLCGFLVREFEPFLITVQISLAANIEEVASFHAKPPCGRQSATCHDTIVAQVSHLDSLMTSWDGYRLSLVRTPASATGRDRLP